MTQTQHQNLKKKKKMKTHTYKYKFLNSNVIVTVCISRFENVAAFEVELMLPLRQLTGRGRSARFKVMLIGLDYIVGGLAVIANETGKVKTGPRSIMKLN